LSEQVPECSNDDSNRESVDMCVWICMLVFQPTSLKVDTSDPSPHVFLVTITLQNRHFWKILCCHCALAVPSFPECLSLSPESAWSMDMCMIDVHD